MTLRRFDLVKPGIAAAALVLAALALAPRLDAAALPGFKVEQVAVTQGFLSGLAVDSQGVIYYTNTSGDILRISGSTSIPVAKVDTFGVGNAGLLGLTLADDRTAVVHYTTPNLTGEVISKIDLITGAETIVKTFPSDPDNPIRPVDAEHHGGNPAIGDDGSIYFGVGDYFAFEKAADPRWIAGKIVRIRPDGTAEQIASGFRNPFGIAWDKRGHRLVVPDNGNQINDEINIVTTGGFYGWPYTAGPAAPVEGAIPPIYSWPEIVAPTGIAALGGWNAMLKRGFLIGGFVTRGLDYLPDLDARPLPPPIRIITKETASVVGVAESAAGEIYFGTGMQIYRLIVPVRGDCNGDFVIDFADVSALRRELADGDPHAMITAQGGLYRASWGCDVNADATISSADEGALWRMFTNRVRAIRR